MTDSERLVLRCLASLQRQGLTASLPALRLLIPVAPADILDALLALDHAGLVDADRLRLTLLGTAVALRCFRQPTPRAARPPTTDRRTRMTPMRKAAGVA